MPSLVSNIQMTKNQIREKKSIELILKELDKGTTFTYCLRLINTKWDLSRSTFARYWKKANAEYDKRQQSIREALTEEYTAKEKEALELALSDKNKHAQDLVNQIKRLSEITAGKSVKVGDTLITATWETEIRAKAEIRAILKQLGDWYGFNAPAKTDNIHKIETLTPIWGHIEPLLEDDTTDDSGE